MRFVCPTQLREIGEVCVKWRVFHACGFSLHKFASFTFLWGGARLRSLSTCTALKVYQNMFFCIGRRYFAQDSKCQTKHSFQCLVVWSGYRFEMRQTFDIATFCIFRF